MKSIFEQNFDELYAQVEERVKCIKPVKQIDTFTKILMWTSLNEILMSIFGGSRFMWQISDKDDTTFVVTFVDRYRLVSTTSLSIDYIAGIRFPSVADIEVMDYDELCDFRKQFESAGFTLSAICTKYNKPNNWYSSLLGRRRIGIKHTTRIPIHGGVKRSADCWDYTKFLLYKLYRAASADEIPMVYHVLQWIDEVPKFEYKKYQFSIYSWEENGNISISVEAYLDQKFQIDKTVIDRILIKYYRILLDIFQEYNTDVFIVRYSKYTNAAMKKALHVRFDIHGKQSTKWIDGVSCDIRTWDHDTRSSLVEWIAKLQKLINQKEVEND